MVDQTKASLTFRLNYEEMVHKHFFAKSILKSKTPKHRFLPFNVQWMRAGELCFLCVREERWGAD
jgi:hypothetical protein